MQINISYDEEFKKDFAKLKKLKYSEELMELDGIGTQLDINSYTKNYFGKIGVANADVSVDSNANIDKVNIANYTEEANKGIHRLNSYYVLWKYGKSLYDEEFSYSVLKKQLTKEIYINDFHGFATGKSYCFNFSCMDIMCGGLPFVERGKSDPPKHLDTYFNQLIEFIAYACNNIMGATGLADIFIVGAYYYDKLYSDNPTIPKEFLDKLAKQSMQGLVYRCNQLYRNGAQTAFTNVSIFDDVFLDKWCEEYTYPDGSKPNKSSIKKLQELFIDVMNETLEKKPITFPVTTVCFCIDEEGKILDEEFLDYVAEKNMRFAFMNIFAGKSSVLSSCCRLRSDNDNVLFMNTFGAGGTKIGSVSVTTLNLPRLAYTANSKQDFLDKLEANVIIAGKINQTRRFIVNKRITNGHYPLYNLGFAVLNKQYSTCGLGGLNEALEIMGFDILTEDGQNFVKEILETVNTTNDSLSKKYKVPFNCEQIPGENSLVKLSKADKTLGLNTEYDIYSNQFIPLTKNADIFDRIKIQGMFDKHMSGGAICHLNIVDRITDKDFMKKLLKKTIEAGVVYHAVNYNLQKCVDGCITVGQNNICDKCGKEIVERFTRVVGFLTPVSNWNVNRRKEYGNRIFYEKKTLDK